MCLTSACLVRFCSEFLQSIHGQRTEGGTCSTTGMAHCRCGATTARLEAASEDGGAAVGASPGGTGGGSGGANRRSDRSSMCISWYMSCLGPQPPIWICIEMLSIAGVLEPKESMSAQQLCNATRIREPRAARVQQSKALPSGAKVHFPSVSKPAFG